EAERWLVVHRGPTAVLVNLGDRERPFPIGQGDVLARSDDRIQAENGTIIVPPDAVAIATTR
ncbi:MAG: DUF3459 domain-containing protein, partial [Acidimicrobiia bacterium]